MYNVLSKIIGCIADRYPGKPCPFYFSIFCRQLQYKKTVLRAKDRTEVLDDLNKKLAQKGNKLMMLTIFRYAGRKGVSFSMGSVVNCVIEGWG